MPHSLSTAQTTPTQHTMKFRIATVLIATAAALSFSGCAGTVISGKSYDSTLVSKIQKGKTTKQEVRMTFGEPVSTKVIDGGEVWNYYYQSVSFMNENHSLDVYFSKDGVVTDYRNQDGKSLF